MEKMGLMAGVKRRVDEWYDDVVIGMCRMRG